jgi:hypothetical protein
LRHNPVLALFLLLFVVLAASGCTEPCRVGFDVGSSGVRVGSSCRPETERVAIDYLADVWASNAVSSTIEPTVDALRTLPGKAGLESGGPRVAGGYSAWRLALEKGGADRMAATLAEIEARSGVRLLVIPQDVEGDYGYYAARQALGERLATDAILDIGGGSLQIARPGRGWGDALGQRAWRRLFCAEVKGDTSPECSPNPVGQDAMARAQAVLASRIAEAREKLGQGFTVTAVSSPLVRGIHPAIRSLAARHGGISGQIDEAGFDRTAIESAITALAGLNDAAMLDLLDQCRKKTDQPSCRSQFIGTVVTDMLLVRTLMLGLGIERIEVAAADLTNVPGLLADSRATAWSADYACYLARLRRLGIDAFVSDVASCPRCPLHPALALEQPIRHGRRQHRRDDGVEME